MGADSSTQSQAEQDAARWFATLNSATVSTGDLATFHQWRRDPGNDAAYRHVEAVWGKSAGLAADPAIREALAAAQGRAARRKRHLGPLWLAPAGVLALSAIAVTVFIATRTLAPQDYSTAVGEQRTVTLQDGSKVRLDTDTQIAVRYRPESRIVTLTHGRAYFDVVHKADRPFRVIADATTINDLGTRFDVRRNGDQVQVTLVQGAIQVEHAGASKAVWQLTPGQQLTTGLGAAPRVVDTAAATSWTTGRLVFNDVPLSTATAEVDRYARQRIVLAAADVGSVRVTGAFDSNDPQGFVSAVTKLYNLTAHSQADGSIVLSEASPPNST